MRKNIGFLAGILSLVLVFGLAMILTSCEVDTAQVEVKNNTSSTATIALLKGDNSEVASRGVPAGESITFTSLDPGDYWVRVTASGWSYSFPSSGTRALTAGDLLKLEFGGFLSGIYEVN